MSEVTETIGADGRKVFSIDVGNLSPEEALRILDDLKKKHTIESVKIDQNSFNLIAKTKE